MSIFLDCFKNNGYEYLRIVDGRRIKKEDGTISNKRITIKNLGHLKKFDDGQGDGLLLRVREQFKNRTLDIGMDYDELFEKKVEEKIVIRNPVSKLDPKNIGYFFLDNLFNKLGISEVIRKYKSDKVVDYDILGLSKLLVFGRTLNPGSKKATFEERDKYLFNVTSSDKLDEIYKVLDILDEKSESIQTRMNLRIKQSSIGRNTSLTYFDVTNYHFETMYGDDDIYALDDDENIILDEKGKPIILRKGLRKKGVSKKHVPNPIVSMGLLIDNNGIPVSYDIFPGNMQDKTIFGEIIKKSINNPELERIVMVSDNGMYAQGNMYALIENNNGYIISKSVKKHWDANPTKSEEKSLHEWAFDETGYNYKEKDGIMTFKSKSRIYERVLKDKNGNKMTIKEKQVVFWSKKHYEKEVFQNKKFIEYLESCKKNPDKLKDRQRKSQDFIKVIQMDEETGEVLKTKSLVILLEDKIQKYKDTMGFYSVITSEIELEDSEIINRYHGLSRIEDSFRVIGSELEGRPMYVWLPEHINAHFLLCFIALTMIRLIQYKVLKHQGKDTLNTDGWTQGITAEKLRNTLSNFNANLIGDGFYQITEMKDDMELITKALRVEMDLLFPDLSRLSGLKDKIAKIEL